MNDNAGFREALVESQMEISEHFGRRDVDTDTMNELFIAIRVLDVAIDALDRGDRDLASRAFQQTLRTYNEMLRALETDEGTLGLAVRNQRRDFAYRTNEERQAEAHDRHDRWLKDDLRLADEKPRLTSKLARAKAIRHALNETATADHIARHLPRR